MAFTFARVETTNAQERRHRPHPAARQQGRRRARSTRPDKT
ncbi:hypothetical protein L810_6514 [Burkholderia sp. AU4i]|nr:hypothetical protein L810_6514 [Burkholderia sp. AU4i]